MSEQRAKYGNVVTEIDGVVFHSRKEARRWQDLQLMQAAGVITGLARQVAFELQPAFRDRQGKWQAAIKYVADFSYLEGGQLIAEDVKGGPVTQVFALKAKLFRRKFPDIELRIT